MSRLDATLEHLAPGVAACIDRDGLYNPRHGLAIYCLPDPEFNPSAPGVVLGEALAAKSGLGCTLLEGVPAKVPEGAVVVGNHAALKALRPDLLGDIPDPADPGEYSILLGRFAVVTSPGGEGLAAGMQTLAMLVLRCGEEPIPAAVITDSPVCQTRGLAVELATGEIGLPLLMQIASFAATFKANCLHLILDDDFSAGMEIPGIETFVQSCQSFGIRVGVRLPLLAPLLAGKRTPNQVWAAIRAVARVFHATEAGLDDPCPPGAGASACARVVESLAKGGTGMRRFCIDAEVLVRSGASASDLQAAGICGWKRWNGDGDAPDAGLDALPLLMDVPASLPGFSSRPQGAFHARLDAALRAARVRERRELFVSFRNVGISHMWQNMLYPAATAFIAAWGCPASADESAWRYSNLLYGDSARAVMGAWDTVSGAFPAGLDDAAERLVRRVAFGYWPETEAETGILLGIDWLEVTKNIRVAAEILKNTAAELTRNALTLAGARLALYALSWLHCFVALEPELERRRREGVDEDGRTGPIAAELYNNFGVWVNQLREVVSESGMEFAEAGRIEAMGLRLRALCGG